MVIVVVVFIGSGIILFYFFLVKIVMNEIDAKMSNN